MFTIVGLHGLPVHKILYKTSCDLLRDNFTKNMSLVGLETLWKWILLRICSKRAEIKVWLDERSFSGYALGCLNIRLEPWMVIVALNLSGGNVTAFPAKINHISAIPGWR